MQTEQVKLSLVKVNQDNPRTITSDKFAKLVDSLLVFPKMLTLRPVVVDHEFKALGGNMRTQALNAIKGFNLDAIRQRLEKTNDYQKLKDDERVKLLEFWGRWLAEPVCHIIKADTLTEAERRQFIIKDNVAFGAWDFDMLANMFDTSELNDWGMDLWDMSSAADQDAQAAAKEGETPGEQIAEEPANVQEDVFDEAQDKIEARAKTGDLWKLGNHLLICGDSTDEGTLLELMGNERANLVFTDPPYGMGKEADGVQNDNLYRNKLLEFNKQWIPLSFKYMQSVGSWYCWGLEEPLMRIYAFILLPMIEACEIVFRNEIVWDKGTGQGMGSELLRSYARASERCLFVMKGVEGFNNNKDNFYEPFAELLNWFLAERDKMGWSTRDAIKVVGRTTASHYFTRSQWEFPHREAYEKLQEAAHGCAFTKSYNELEKRYNVLVKGNEELRDGFYSRCAYFNNTHENMCDIWYYESNSFGAIRSEFLEEAQDAGGHATPKPLKLCSRGIMSSSRPGDIVLDMFGGSGSTLIACEKLGRKCRMIELEPHFCDVILARWEKLTGLKAERLNN